LPTILKKAAVKKKQEIEIDSFADFFAAHP
jgi:hypothetical protein